MRILLPLLLLLLGTAGGVGAAWFLTPPAVETEVMHEEDPCGPGEAEAAHTAQPSGEDHATDSQAETGREYVRLNNQFVVPVVSGEDVAALVVLSLSLEMVPGAQQIVFDYEPKLRDAFLQVMFDHANLGGFDGAFTSTSNMRTLRESLLSAARQVLGQQVLGVLIFDLVRQDT